jgi:hypothetical protein
MDVRCDTWGAGTFAAQARSLAPRCFERLAKILEGDDPAAAVEAARLLLAYGYGAPQQVHVVQTEVATIGRRCWPRRCRVDGATQRALSRLLIRRLGGRTDQAFRDAHSCRAVNGVLAHATGCYGCPRL